MEGREERDPGYDDWFDEPEPPQGRGTRAVFEDDDAWVLPESGPSRGRGRRREPIVIAGREVGTAQFVIVGVCTLAVLFAVLAAAGVFNSPGRKPPASALTTQTTPPIVSPSVTTPTVPHPGSGLTQAKPGDTGAAITALQNALTTLGFSPGKADGDYGPATQLAVEHFQASHNLGVDGVVGPKTLAALQKALSG